MKNENKEIEIKKPTWNGISNRNKPAIVLMSGGLDSSVLLYKSLIEYPRVLALGFDYGQKNKSELEAAKKICSDFGVEFRILNATFIKDLTKGCYLLEQTDVWEKETIIVPFRNGFFLEMAMCIAANENYQYILLGGLLTEIGTIDKNPIALRKLQNVFIQLAEIKNKIEIKLPFVDEFITKEKVFLLADNYGILDYLKENVVTCYDGHKGVFGCKTCLRCQKTIINYELFKLRKGWRKEKMEL